MTTTHPTGTVTFLFTDIEGSTKLAREHPETWDTTQARHHAILRGAIESNNGFVFQIIGDAFCAAFHKAGDALKAALKSQQDLQNEPWGEAVIRARMGIHTGEAETDGKDYRGYLTMSLIQRMMSAGHGGQILLSNATENLLRDQLPKNVSLRDMGEHKFKDVPHLVRVFQIVAPPLQSEFPALRTLSVSSNNLPSQLTSFVGREKELADVKKLLHDAHMLTLIGPGGTGKTRLSIQAAQESLTEYPDGVWLVELASILDPLLVPRTTALAMGLRDEPQRPVIDMLCDYLREKKMLIILDNCEHLVDACAQMADKLLHAASHTRILASSREALGIAGEVTYRVPSLGLPDMEHLSTVESLSQFEAVRLFIDRATSAVSTFTVTNNNAPFLAQICHRLDGIPLAIELAAAKIRVLSVEQIAKRLDDRFRLLTGGSRTALERHQTLRATLDWSYNLLPPAEQTLFRRLAIFVGGWTLEAAESVCGDESTSGLVRSDDVLDLVEHLINKSIVVKEEKYQETRYRMLETMRQYANEKLVDSNESDALRDNHLEYYMKLAEDAAPHLIQQEQLEWLAQLDADYENLRAALEWALSKETAESSLRLCAALGKFWEIRCYWLEGSKWLSSALAKSTPTPTKVEQIARVRALYWDVILAENLDDIERMKTSAELCFTLAQDVSDQREIAIARFMNGCYLDRREDHSTAFSIFEESFARFKELNDPYWTAVSHKWLSSILVIKGNCDFAEIAMQGVELARKAGERKHLGETLFELSYWHFRHNRLDEAVKVTREADLLLKEIGSALNTASMLYAEMAWAADNYEEAERLYMDIQERLGLIGEKNLRSAVVACLGILTMERGNVDQAQVYLERALATARELENNIFTAYRLAELSRVFHLQGNIGKFRQAFRESISLTKGFPKIHKVHPLLTLLQTIYTQKPQISALALGAIDTIQKEELRPLDPIHKRYWTKIEIQACEMLGNEDFESAFTEGQKLSLDDILDLVLKSIDETIEEYPVT